MRTIEISGITGNSIVYIGESIKNISDYINIDKTTIITDSNVKHHYEHYFPRCKVIEIGTGEKIKTLDTVKTIYEKLIEFEVDRSCFILGIGGGIVCDIAGFVASTYMRGIDFGFVSTSLLSQVDASIGGKNGINFSGYKNMVGVFNQPQFVICDLDMLSTLPKKILQCGFAEIVKYAAIYDGHLFSFIEDNYKNALELNKSVIEKLVYDSINIKSTVVKKDEKEKGERRKLNFGHTFGHAIEKTTGMPHGESISIGMIAAAELSVKRHTLSYKEAERIKRLLQNFSLPVKFPVNKERLKDALRKDKKRKDNNIQFVLLKKIGNAFVKEIEIKELEKVIDDMY